MIQSYLKNKALKKGYVISTYKTNSYGWTARVIPMDMDNDVSYKYILLRSMDSFIAMCFGRTELQATYKAYLEIKDK